MKKLRLSLGLLVLIFALSSMKLSAVNLVPFGEITGKKTESTTTEPKGGNSDEKNGQDTGGKPVFDITATPPLFSRGRVETLFPVSYKVPEQWLGEFSYDDHNDPIITYYPGLDNFDNITQVLSYAADRQDRTDEEFLRYIMDTIKEEDDYVSLQYRMEQAPDFPYARLSLEKKIESSIVHLDRFYRVIENEVILFQSYAFDEPDRDHVAITEAMFLSQYIDDTKSEIPSSWKSITHEKAVFRYPQTWEFTEMEDTADGVDGLVHLTDDGLTFLSIIEEYDTRLFESTDDYFYGLETYAKWLAGLYQEVEIVGVDIYVAKDVTMHLHLFGTVDGEVFETQVYTMIDKISNSLYSITLETYAEPDGPKWEMIELFDTIVETFEITNDPSVGQA